MRNLSTATELLSETERKSFLECHIPYRLKLLRLGLVAAPARSLIHSAVVEASIIAGRQLIQFLGLGIKFEGKKGPILESNTCYKSFGKGDDRCYEVKIVNLGGEFQDFLKLQPDEKRILAEFMYGTDKATAHLTEDSNHQLWANRGEVFFQGCELIIKLVADALLTLQPAASAPIGKTRP